MDYRSIIESRYNRRNWLELLHDIFGQKLEVWQQPQPVIVNQNMAKSALYVGKITLADGKSIAIYEVELTDSVVIERNRTGIRNLLCQNWKGMFDGAFMFCYRQNESVLRFSYVSESFNFTEDGALAKESTDTKRFTYLLGEGHRSRTAIQQFETLRRSNQTLSDVTKAFSVEALSKMFFDEYKRQYENIIFFITGKRMVRVASKWEERTEGTPCAEIMNQFARFTNPEKAVRDYVKKLMGRLVFIQFLQKKGWMGCPAGDEWNDGDREFVQNLFAKTPFKDTFVDDVLEPLFNDINTRRKDDLTTNANLGSGIKIPYLNGGLFERDDFDKTDFPLPARYMKEMLDFFASYNFTIDENDPDDAEIGVDPEMLGRIFENLLEDNKDKGAFYTPKEIVHYMCRESLIAYLQTDVASDEVRESFRQFVTTHDVSLLKPADVYKVDRKLRDVKICDPAIGSGAFPMGLLRELFACRMAIEGMEQGTTPADVKKDIIQNSIYGVDIEKGAVDIARLRFWLSLILDEETPHALPNMDFKIMQGNSLLEQYEGIDLSGISLDAKTKQSKLKDENDAMDQSLALDEKDSLSNIQDLIKSYFQTENYEKKVEIRKNVDANIRSYIRTFKGCTGEIEQKINSLSIPNDQFFLWHIYFKDVFDKGGFDIVIGNPPYLRIQGMRETNPEEADLLSKNYVSATGSFDLYVCFVELGFNVINEAGLVNYIMPIKWSNAAFGNGLRELVSKKKAASKIINFGAYQVFNASTYTALQWFHQNSENLEYVELDRDLTTNTNLDIFLNSLNSTSFSSIHISKLSKETWVLTNDKTNIILDKLNSQPRRVSDVFDKIFQGLATGRDNVYFLSKCIYKGDIVTGYSKELNKNVTIEVQLTKPLLKGEDVHKYDDIKTDRVVVLPYEYRNDSAVLLSEKSLKTKYPLGYDYFKQCETILRGREHGRFNIDGEWFQLSRKQGLNFASFEKLVAPEISLGGNFSYDERGVFYSTTKIYGYLKNKKVEASYKTLMAIMNSKVMWFFMQNTGYVLRGGYYTFKTNYVSPFPIPSDESILYVQSQLENLVNQILSIKKENIDANINRLESEIDQLVYKLYDLTPEEIAIVENSTK